ncbi:diguanylate cyclase [Caenibius tardaugens NBRC 16725]|nr:diguanylate cyclase [Caenibius tardaugens NBRC 16725]
MPACIFTSSGKIVRLNTIWQKERGYRKESDLALTFDQLLHVADWPSVVPRLHAILAAPQPSDITCRLGTGKWEGRWFQLNIQPLPSPKPGEQHWLCIAMDIDDCKMREAQLEQRIGQQNAMLDASADCIKMLAPDGTLVHMNRTGCQSVGLPKTSILGVPWLPLLPEDVQTEGIEALAIARKGSPARFNGRSVTPDQQCQYWENSLTPMITPDGQLASIVCVSREVTAAYETLQSLKVSEERLSMAARVGGLGIWDYNIVDDRMHCDAAWYHIMGRDPAHPISSIGEFRSFIHPEDVERATEVVQTAAELVAQKADYGIVFRIVRPNGDIRWVRSAACLQTREGVAVRVVGFVIDITDAWRGELALRDANRALAAEKSSLARQTLEDPLTGIANRRHWDSELTRIFLHASETGKAMCVGMIDVDHFKSYNDRNGHLAGDVALQKVAKALHSVARQSDFVARYGGEEFAFVLMNAGDPSRMLDRFMAAIAHLAIPQAESPTGCMTISCGCVVAAPCEKLTPAQLLEASDKALYTAKTAGRNRYIVHTAAMLY